MKGVTKQWLISSWGFFYSPSSPGRWYRMNIKATGTFVCSTSAHFDRTFTCHYSFKKKKKRLIEHIDQYIPAPPYTQQCVHTPTQKNKTNCHKIYMKWILFLQEQKNIFWSVLKGKGRTCTKTIIISAFIKKNYIEKLNKNLVLSFHKDT